MEAGATSRHVCLSDISGATTVKVSMRGYISRLAPPDDPWPEAYVVVVTSPHTWMTTFSLGELIAVLDGQGPATLRGIPYAWHDAELVVSFGPAQVVGDREGWLALARRLVESASSASELLEAPGARRWSGATESLSVDAVELGDGARGRGDGATPQTPDAMLAAAGGFSDAEFLDVFGFGWRPGRSLEEDELFAAEVFVRGSPVQLAAAVGKDGKLGVGRPSGRWNGPGSLEYTVDDAVALDGGMPRQVIESHVSDLLRRRRRTFSWCRYCGSPLAPENRLARGLFRLRKLGVA